MNSLEVKCPLLPDNGQIVIVELRDETVLMAKYTAKPWKVAEDLQKSFEPIGVKIENRCGIVSCYAGIVFNCDIVSWKGYK